MRQFQITLPEEKVGQVMEFLEEKAQIRNIAKIHTTPGFMLIFRVSTPKSQQILTNLETIGVGVHYGIIDILPVEASKPMPKEEEVKITPTERLSVEEIYEKIASGARLSFDFIILLIISGIIAAIGLAYNSVVIIVASMLLAPLMGPILAFSLGAVIRDKRLVITGLLNETLGLIIAVVMGVIMGVALLPWSQIPPVWPTTEMLARGEIGWVFVGMVVAAASGAGVALAVTRGEISSLVGVAIAASLMPPAVNAGINLIFAFIGPVFFPGLVNGMLHLLIAGASLLLVLVNILFINIVAMGIFTLKQVGPIKSKSIFWHDLPRLDKKHRDELWHR